MNRAGRTEAEYPFNALFDFNVISIVSHNQLKQTKVEFSFMNHYFLNYKLKPADFMCFSADACSHRNVTRLSESTAARMKLSRRD